MMDNTYNNSSKPNQAETLELFLLNLRYREGRLIDVTANKPILLNDPEMVWIIYSGVVDLFATPVVDNEVTGVRTHLFRSQAGQILFGLPMAVETAVTTTILVSGIQARLLGIKRTRFLKLAAELEYADLITTMIDDWITALSITMSTKLPPKDVQMVSPEALVNIPAQAVAIPKQGILWVKVVAGTAVYLDRPDLGQLPSGQIPSEQFSPFSKYAWLCILDACDVKLVKTDVLQTKPEWGSWLGCFHRTALTAIVQNIAHYQAAEVERLHHKAQSERLVMNNALTRLASPLASSGDISFAELVDDGPDRLLNTCRIIGNAMGIDIKTIAGDTQKQTLGQALNSIAHASRIRMREVTLSGQWWQQDNGPLLGFRAEDQQPVALIPTSTRNYTISDTATRTNSQVTSEIAAQLLPFGYTFYRPLPTQMLNAWDLLKFGVAGNENQRDLRMVSALGILIGLLSLLPPVATGWLFDNIIPEANKNALFQVGIGLLILAIAMGMLRITRGIALLRLQNKMDVSMQAAIWDRLLNLPVSFFRNFSAGDLGSRAMGISTIRQIVSGYVITTILTSLFASFNLLLLFYYAPGLAGVAVGLMLLSIGFTLIIGRIYIKYQRQLTDIQGDLSGTMLQLLTGIMKLRVAGAERQAFSIWAERFTKQKRVYYKARRITNKLTVFNIAYPVFASIMLFTFTTYWISQEITTGDFLAFYLALLQFLGAWFMLSSSLVHILTIVPVYERMKPILAAAPEVDDEKEAPGELTGAIEINHLSFRYKSSGPLVLKDVSLTVQPGEFVAFVGASGSGKSTMFRMLLGFEKPETGGIFYDDQDLGDFDVREVRKQIGVVMQNAIIQAGNVYKNIVGASLDLTIEDAWEAAGMAGFDKDINGMPMGMHTVVSARGGNLSGGQRQRLLIARALVNRPRILFFDEATSALDNRTQDVVNHHLEGINATRVVIAHRLTTIMKADRIYLFDNGRIAQSGTYDELINQPGHFAELAQRQMAF